MKRARIILIILCVCALLGGWRYWKVKQANVDTEGPVLSADEDEIEVPIKATDAELTEGVTAWDETDGDVSDNIIIETIEMTSEDDSEEFEITYVAFDAAGNVGRLTRTLVYTDYRQTHFELTGELRLAQNGSWSLFDYVQADDCIDGDLSPFITIDGSEDVQSDSSTGTYKCTLSVTNSVGDTTELPIQVEIYEDTYEEQTFRPSIVLSNYLTYVEKDGRFNPEDYIDHVADGGTYMIDYGEMIETEKNGETVLVTEKEYNEEAGNWVNITEIGISSNVDTSVTGVYSVLYTYTSESTGYDCSTRLIVVVE
ncbi:MAG: hypothetical protein LUH53_00220 [Lachnospiraceae bacterium]|nr:hypothetical protein [Lachnospiraceae bacterium]